VSSSSGSLAAGSMAPAARSRSSALEISSSLPTGTLLVRANIHFAEARGHHGRTVTIEQHHGRKVFGIGLSRTATTSLNLALERLGLRSAHFPADAKTREEVGGCIRSECQGLRLSVLEVCDALTDTPVCATYKALDAAYPGSRFILTVRAKEDWLRSCERYWGAGLSAYIEEHPEDPLSGYIKLISEALYGSADFERDSFARAYDRYHADVADHFGGRDGDLITMDVTAGDGWERLCGFLDRPEPDEPFPAANRMPGQDSSDERWVLAATPPWASSGEP
jgi:hypothetical protein